jgi:hypothetical protein
VKKRGKAIQKMAGEHDSDHFRMFKYFRDLDDAPVDVTSLFADCDKYKITVQTYDEPRPKFVLGYELKLCVRILIRKRLALTSHWFDVEKREDRYVRYYPPLSKFLYCSEIYGSHPRLFSLGQLASAARVDSDERQKKWTQILSTDTEIIPPLVSIIIGYGLPQVPNIYEHYKKHNRPLRIAKQEKFIRS